MAWEYAKIPFILQTAGGDLRLGFCWIAIFCITGLIVGCERTPVTPTATATAPTTAPAEGADTTDALQAANHPAQPRASVMLIDQQRISFPPAKLVLRTRGGSVHALLYSDDPPQAIEETYTGNSFYLELPLDISDPQELSLAKWIYKAPHSERADTVNGIYLHGRKQHLQPFDLVIEFEQHAGGAKVWMSGDFLLFDAADDPTMPGRITPVAAELDADLTLKAR